MEREEEFEEKDDIVLDTEDMWAMIFAVFQLLLPYVILIAVIFALFVWFITMVWLR